MKTKKLVKQFIGQYTDQWTTTLKQTRHEVVFVTAWASTCKAAINFIRSNNLEGSIESCGANHRITINF